jgi:3-dehydroquinate dehydratase-2
LKILLLNGPNLNVLGKRDSLVYGTESFEKILDWLQPQFPDLEITYQQSNHEGQLIDWIQQAEESGFKGLLINPGGYSHYSVAILDALLLAKLWKVEVHLSPIYARDNFRQQSMTAAGCHGLIAGFGKESYRLGLEFLRKQSSHKVGFRNEADRN